MGLGEAAPRPLVGPLQPPRGRLVAAGTSRCGRRSSPAALPRPRDLQADAELDVVGRHCWTVPMDLILSIVVVLIAFPIWYVAFMLGDRDE